MQPDPQFVSRPCGGMFQICRKTWASAKFLRNVILNRRAALSLDSMSLVVTHSMVQGSRTAALDRVDAVVSEDWLAASLVLLSAPIYARTRVLNCS